MTGAGAAQSAAPAFARACTGGSGLHLSDGVHAVRVEEDVVCLDVFKDTYSILSDPDRSLRILPDSNALVVNDQAFAAALIEAGLASLAGARRRRAVAPSPVDPSPPARVAANLRLSDFRDFSRLMIKGPLRHRLASLSALVSWSDRRRPAAPKPLIETVRRAQVFSDLLTLAPVQGDCLFRSHLLLRFLRMGGCDARWVFAVRTWPFAAHCWLQLDELVLNDAPDRLRAFHPIASF